MARLSTAIVLLALGGLVAFGATAVVASDDAPPVPGDVTAEPWAPQPDDVGAASTAGTPDNAGVQSRPGVAEEQAPSRDTPLADELSKPTRSSTEANVDEALNAQEQSPLLLDPDRLQVQADKLFVTEQALAGEGNVIVRTDKYTIYADSVEIDRRSEVARFKGHIVLEGESQRTEGTDLWVDLDSGWWRIEGTDTRVEPEFFTTEVLEPLFARGGVADYEPDKDTILIRDGRLTSCDLWHHYELRSSRITLKPGDRVEMHNPSLYLWGHRVFKYPFDVSFSLRQEKQKIFPEIGENDVEGRFLKLATLYYLNTYNNGVARLHITEKRGVGLGFDHLMEDTRQTLDLSAFYEPSEGALAARTRHSYSFSRSLRSDLSTDYQTNSGYLYSSKTLNSDLTFRNVDPDSDTTLGFQQSTTSYSGGASRRFGSSFYHNQRLGRRTQWSLRDTYVRSRYASQDVPDEEMNTDFQLRHQARAFDLDVQASKRSDLDNSRYTGDDNYYALDRLPAILVNTDTRRLGDWRLLGRAYTRLQAELGYFRQQPENEAITRGAFTMDLGGYEQTLDAHTTARTGLRFRQSWFDDGSAQYNTGFSGELRHAIDGHWNTRLAYDWVSTRGFAPLRLDYGGRAHEVQLQFVRFAPDRSRIELSSGFDFISDSYRDLRLQAELRSSRRSYWRIQGAYSFERSEWWPLLLRYTTASTPVYLDLTARYDIERSKLASVTVDMDWQMGSWWRMEFVGSYSGFTSRIDQADIRLTRDLHCLIAQLTYSKWPNELSFAIGIKAFPAVSRTLGIGATGAYLPGSAGEYY